MRIGLCEKCGEPADARYEVRNNSVYLVKSCKECGRTSSLVTTDARKWSWKRAIMGYQEPTQSGCSMECASCSHHEVTPPYTVSIDVTNRCNQRCPICLAYVDAMGFTYEPPMDYFRKIFEEFKDADPRPNMCFFGGEPTVHPNFLEIVQLARSYGFQAQLFTNGLKLADKDYCRKLCDLGVQVNLGFDGTTPEIYQTLRGDNSLAVKKRALDNLIECKVNKLAVISTVAIGVNDDNLMRILELIHERRDHVSVWGFVPLTPCWDSPDVSLTPTTTECVENVFERMIPEAEFVPTGMMKFGELSRFFGRQTLGGSHPNCESATLFVSNGEKYEPISSYLTMPLSELLQQLRKLDAEITALAVHVPQTGARRKLFDMRTLSRTALLLKRAFKFNKLFQDGKVSGIAGALMDLVRGEKVDHILKTRTSAKNLLTLITIPYEDKGGLEDARLKDCPAVFAYEDVETGRIRTTAFCSWQTVKDDVCKRIQAHYDELNAHGDQQKTLPSAAGLNAASGAPAEPHTSAARGSAKRS